MRRPAARDCAALGKLGTIQHRFILQTDEAPPACRAPQPVARPSCESTPQPAMPGLSWPHVPSRLPTGGCCPRDECANWDHQSCPMPPPRHQDFNDLRRYRRGSPTACTPAETCNESINKRWAIIVGHLSANCRKETVAFPPLLSTD